MNEKMVLEILELCLQAKRLGYNCFFRYSPNVNLITVEMHESAWNGGRKVLGICACTDDIDKLNKLYASMLEFIGESVSDRLKKLLNPLKSSKILEMADLVSQGNLESLDYLIYLIKKNALHDGRTNEK
jgi:hypothetical protein